MGEGAMQRFDKVSIKTEQAKVANQTCCHIVATDNARSENC